MSSEPQISVCIPAYQARAHLRKAVLSVLNQTRQDFEIVIVDDASQDGTLESICDLEDPRIRRYANPINLGGGANWNLAVERSKGKLIKLLCSDDILYPDCLEKQARILEDTHWDRVGLVCCWRDVIDANGRVLVKGKPRMPQGHIPGRHAVRKIVRSGTNPLGEPGSVLFRRELLTKVGTFDGSNPFVLDIDMWSRMLFHSDLYMIPEILCGFRISAESWSVRLARGHSQDYANWIDYIAGYPDSGITPGDRRLGRARAVLWSWARMLLYRTTLRQGRMRGQNP